MITATFLWLRTSSTILRNARAYEEVDRAGRKPFCVGQRRLSMTGRILFRIIRLQTFAANSSIVGTDGKTSLCGHYQVLFLINPILLDYTPWMFRCRSVLNTFEPWEVSKDLVLDHPSLGFIAFRAMLASSAKNSAYLFPDVVLILVQFLRQYL